MKNYRLLLLSWIAFFSLILQAQEKREFLFEEYQDAMVYFKGLLQSQEKVNYHLVKNKLYFIDKGDGRIKELSDIGNILVIKVGDREFVPTRDGMQEMFPTTPLIYVQYRAKGIPKAPKGAYGVAQGAAITTYSEFREGGAHAKLKEYDYEIKEYYNDYWIEKNDKKRAFKDFKQFLKLYPKHKTVLQEYIREKNVDFMDVQAMIALCLYAESL